MPNVNYMNPASLAPQFDPGPLRGLQQYDQAMDYRKGMDVQNFLATLGTQRAQQEQNEFMAGAPLRALKGQAESETLQGSMPFLRELAGQGAQRDIAERKFDIGTKFSDPAKLDFFRKMKQSATDDQWKNSEREMVEGAQLMNEALRLQQTNGLLVAQQHVQQRLSALKQRGINLPQQFNNPQTWKPVLEATVEHIGHMREVDKENIKGQYSLEEQRLANQGALAAAQQRAASERNQNLDQQMAYLINQIRLGKTDQANIDALEAHIFRKWNDTMTRNPELQLLTMQAREAGAQGQAAQAELNRRRDEFFRYQSMGLLQPKPPTPKPGGKKGWKIEEVGREQQ